LTRNMLDYAGAQIGGKRAYQEDAFAFHALKGKDESLICLLADGMGGHAAGDVAANTSIDAFSEAIDWQSPPLKEQFIRALDKANRAIYRKAKDDPAKAGMGCTFVAVEVVNGLCNWISIGDSPLFHISGSKISRINADHSMAQQLDAAAARGEISVEEARTSSSRNILLSALTGDPISRVDQSKTARPLVTGDWIILASDGLETLEPDEILSLIHSNPGASAKQMCGLLLDAVEARDKPSQDNATVMAVRMLEQPAQPADVVPDDEVITRPIRAG